MIDTVTLQRLVEFGMTEREAKLYLALLTKPEMTPPELHRLSGVPRTKIYETIAAMIARGFCQERSSGRKKYYSAIRPAQLRDALIGTWERDFAEKKQAANKTLSDLDKHYQQQVELDPSLDQIEVIRSAEQVHQHYIKHNLEAEFEVLTFNRSPYAVVSEKLLKEQEKVVATILERGITLRTIYMMEGEHWSWLFGHLKRSRDQGETPRVIGDLPMKMFIFDRKKVMLALPSIQGRGQGGFTMLLIEDPGFTRSCMILFETVWGQSFTIEEWNQKVIDETNKNMGSGGTARLEEPDAGMQLQDASGGNGHRNDKGGARD